MNLSPLPVQKFFSSNGRPLEGGLLFTYIAGTSTKQATYTDASGGQQNTNPVVLDFRGEANVWLDPALTYKFVLSPANDTDPPTHPIWTVDNIAAPFTISQLTRQLIGRIFYPLSDAEIIAGVTVVNWYEYYGNINRYGTNAVPGTTDMTAALQAALNVGQAVYVPNGTYKITTACQMKTASQLIYGDGQLSILLATTDIEILYSSTSVFGVVVQDIQLKNTYTGGGGGPTHFHIHFGTGASGCTVLRCSLNTSLTGSVVSTAFHAGVWFEGANLNNILDCTFGMAQILMGSTDSTIRGGFVYSFAFEYAIKVVSAGEVVIEGVRGILGGPSKGCIWLTAPGYMNKIVNNYFGGSLTTINIGEGVLAEQQQMLQILGNTFHEVDKIAVHLVNPASGCVITGNSFWAGDPKQNDVLTGVQITGSAGQFSCTATTIVVNSTVTISGTYGGTGSISGYSNPTTYYVIATNGTTTFTLSATLGGAAITTSAGTPTGLTYASSSIPGYQDVYVESALFGASSVVIQNNICNRFNGPVEDGMPGLGKSNAIEFNTFSGVANNVVRNNSISGARYYAPAIVNNNPSDSVGDNVGTTFSLPWVPADLSGATLTFTDVDCRYINDADSVTVWGTLTFPATASGSAATIGGLPAAPAAGMSGAIGSMRSDSATVQKVRLSPGNAYFFLTDTSDNAQTNATCSGKSFSFYGRYLR